jgi:NADH:ubiquinone oxidoreductase subunit K
MQPGINHFVVLSAVIFGFGVLAVILHRSRLKAIIGLSMVFLASLLNIAAFSGSAWFNPQGQIVLLITAVICILVVLTGVFISHKKSEEINNEQTNS